MHADAHTDDDRRSLRPLQLMRRYADAARSGDWETGFGFFAEDVVIHVPGRSDLAGERRGKAAVRGYIETTIARAHGGKVEVELVDTLASAERVALFVRERFHMPKGMVEIRRCNVYRIRDGEIVEVWIFEADQYEVDAMFADAA